MLDGDVGSTSKCCSVWLPLLIDEISIEYLLLKRYIYCLLKSLLILRSLFFCIFHMNQKLHIYDIFY